MRRKAGISRNITPIILLFFLCGGFFASYFWVNKITTKSCFRFVKETTRQFASDIHESVTVNREKMELVARMLAHDNVEPEVVQEHINSFETSGTVEDIGVLLPDGSMVSSNDKYIEWAETLDFETEAKRIPYLSDKCELGEKTEEKFVYHAVPVFQDGVVKGILYGFVPLDVLPQYYTTEVFQGESQQYLIDTINGDLLMDTWHDTLGNLFDGSMEREVKLGYSKEDWAKKIRSGEECYLVSYSEKADEAFYIYSVPVGVNRWAVMLTVPESVAFQENREILLVQILMGVFDAGVLMLYFMWLIKGRGLQVKSGKKS